jgi:hypothetical protein
MKFDVYYAFRNKEGKVCPGIKPHPMEWDEIKRKVLKSKDVKELVVKFRATGDADSKKWLPSIGFVGTCTSTRKAAAMIPTQLVMIDIDHCRDAKGAWDAIVAKMTYEWVCKNVYVAHITPSGKGLHIIFKGQGFATLKENMDWLDEQCNFSEYGDYDSVVHDFARISFAFPVEDLLFESAALIMSVPPQLEECMVNQYADPDQGKEASHPAPLSKGQGGKADVKEKKGGIPMYTEKEKAELEKADWRGVPLKTIVAAWVAYRGEPGAQEIHNYYNEMVKYFRNIMGNNKRMIFYLLPKFGHTDEECWSQVVSICRSNTLSSLDKPFYFFLKDKGFYVSNKITSIDSYMLADEPDNDFDDLPLLPPVFREFVKSAPKDFRIPVINALMPILGTLTSYLQAVYPYDDAYHTTSFFSIIYAPPGTGKGFVSRFDFLFDDLRLRDEVQNARETLYLNVLNRKSNNDKAPEMPHTSLRLIPPKNSEAEFLQKQKDNEGYHMYTYAAEMDSWAKGEKAAGGNKSDMIRIAWDNGEYGQQFKSPTTFKGKVRLFWNVLITGTQDQVERYFKNVENGLVTRCSFTSIENQEFQLASYWRPIPKKGMELIRNFMKRCDQNSYEEPCNIPVSDCELYHDEDEFDKNINWRFKFKPRQTVDMSWIMPVINEFHKVQCEKASLAIDRARDVFRRRVGVRGFRLALLCTALYPTLNSRAIETIKGFVKWWMEVDLECMLKLWGAKYNEQAEIEPQLYNRCAFQSLKEEFTKTDLFAVLKQQRIKSPLRNIIYQWNKNGYIEKTGKDTYRKKS